MTLEAWLSVATCGLSADAAARVRREIEDHYHTALQEPGATPQSALRALGDPRVAGHGYRNVLLTAFEARFLKDHVEGEHFMAAHPALRVILPAAYFAAALVCFALGWSQAAFLCYFFTLEAALLSSPYRPEFTRGQLRLHRIARWVWLFMALSFVAGSPRTFWISFPIVAGFSLWFEWRAASIRRKLPVEQWPKSLYL